VATCRIREPRHDLPSASISPLLPTSCVAWIGYAVAVEWRQDHHGSLNARIHRYARCGCGGRCPRGAHGRYADHGFAAERHRVLRLDELGWRFGRALTLMRSTGDVVSVVEALRSAS